jgi:hypothetical protein
LETQRFRQIWIWLLVLVISGISWLAFIKQIIGGYPFGDSPAPDSLLWIIFIFFGLILPLSLLFTKLETGVTKDNIRIVFFPYTSRKIPIKDIAKFQAREYRPIREYGGWGIRWAGRKNMAYNVSGRSGVQLELFDGRRILIGSQRADEFKQALRMAIDYNEKLNRADL